VHRVRIFPRLFCHVFFCKLSGYPRKDKNSLDAVLTAMYYA
jgi:hypothetical protein